jgi:hypothetical protein
MKSRLSNALCEIIGSALGSYYYSHRLIENLFVSNDAPGDPPEGNCQEKSTRWLQRISQDENCDAYRILGAVLEPFMDSDLHRNLTAEAHNQERERIHKALAKYGLSYSSGQVLGGYAGSVTIATLDKIIKEKNFKELEIEFQRALENVDKDPGAAITAACSIFESTCKIYIQDNKLEMPSKEVAKSLFDVVSKHLGFEPGKIEDNDLRKILSGLNSLIEGMSAFRTHAGSAHGHGRKTYKPEPRHARLAVNASHTAVIFIVDAWVAKDKASKK